MGAVVCGASALMRPRLAGGARRLKSPWGIGNAGQLGTNVCSLVCSLFPALLGVLGQLVLAVIMAHLPSSGLQQCRLGSEHKRAVSQPVPPRPAFSGRNFTPVTDDTKIIFQLGTKPLTPRVSAEASATATNNVAPLPWQVSMSEVKKRRDLKKIMIIGAGPIVIGQVGNLTGAHGPYGRERMFTKAHRTLPDASATCRHASSTILGPRP